MKSPPPPGLSRVTKTFFFLVGFLGTSALFLFLSAMNVTGLRGAHIWAGYSDHFVNQEKADAVLLAWFAVPGLLLVGLFLWRRPSRREDADAVRIALIGLGTALLLRGLLLLLPGYL